MGNGRKKNPETVKRIYTEMEKEDKVGAYAAILKGKLGTWIKTKLPKTAEGKLDSVSRTLHCRALMEKKSALPISEGTLSMWIFGRVGVVLADSSFHLAKSYMIG